MNCPEYAERLFWLFQGEGDRKEREDLGSHRADCSPCERYWRSLESLGEDISSALAVPKWPEEERQRWNDELTARVAAVEAAKRASVGRRPYRLWLHAAAAILMVIGTAFGVAWERASWSAGARGQAVRAYLSLADQYYRDYLNFQDAYLYYGLALELDDSAEPDLAAALERARRRMDLIASCGAEHELLSRFAEAEALSSTEPRQAMEIYASISRAAPNRPIGAAAVEEYAALIVKDATKRWTEPGPNAERLRARLREVFGRESTTVPGLEQRLQILQRMQAQSSRVMAAQAQLTIASLFRKAGKTEEAVEAYTLLIKEYRDQPEVVELARQQLGELNY